MPRPPFTFSGNAPLENGLATIRKDLLKSPRRRHFAIVEVCLATDTRTYTDEEAGQTLTVQVVEIDPVVIQDDINTLTEVRARARANRPGQATLDDLHESGNQQGATGPPPEGGVPLSEDEREAATVAAAKDQVAAEDEARADELAKRRGAK